LATEVLRAPASATAAREPRRQGVVRGVPARAAGLLVLAAAVVGAALLSIAVGSRPIPLATVLEALSAPAGTEEHLIVGRLRLPRTLLGLVVGAALGLSGGVLQGITRNPLADPGLLGISAGAALGVVTAIHVAGVAAVSGFVLFAFAGAAATGVVVYALGAAGRDGAMPVKLALAGAAVSALLVSITTAILLLDVQTLDQYRFWVTGSLAGRDSAVLAPVLPFLAAGAVLALAAARSLNALSLGDDVARSLGQRVGLTRLGAFASVVLLTGGAVAVAGPIGFVGLAVPHMARGLVGADHRWTLPYAALLAPLLLLVADVLGRVVARPAELQVGIVTAVVGAPLFVALVRRARLGER